MVLDHPAAVELDDRIIGAKGRGDLLVVDGVQQHQEATASCVDHTGVGEHVELLGGLVERNPCGVGRAGDRPRQVRAVGDRVVGRFSGGAYHPILRRGDEFLKKSLKTALPIRQERAKAVMELDDLVVQKVEALKAKGLTSPYLKSFVVARINPIRFRSKDAAPLSFDEIMDRMTKAAAKLNVEKVKVEDLAKSGGAPED